jgi:PRTRC genetic system protein C
MSTLTIKHLKRKFRFEKDGKTITLPDPNKEHSTTQVMNFYANQYPELTTSTVSGPEVENDFAVYEFKTTIGTKG